MSKTTVADLSLCDAQTCDKGQIWEDQKRFACTNTPASLSITQGHTLSRTHCWWCGWLVMFFSFPSHKPPAISLHPQVVYSSKLRRQRFLWGTTLCLCDHEIILTFIPQEDTNEEQIINEPIINIFVVIILINSWGNQAHRHLCHHGKVMPLRLLFTSRKEA